MAEHFETIDVEISIDGTEYELRRSRIHEAVSEVGVVRCTITSDDGAPEPSGLLGKSVKYAVRLRASDAHREFNGIVVEAVRQADADLHPVTELLIAPRLWRLTKRSNCRVFQEMTTQEIVTQVLEDAGVPSADQEWTLSASYEPRIYCCQYRETDHAFIQRLLSEEGIIFGVVHRDGVDKLMLSDDGSGFGSVEPATVPFRTLMGFDPLSAEVMNLRQIRSVRSDKVFMRHYDFERPKYKLEKEVESQDDGSKTLGVYVYPGRFTDDALGERYAQVLLDAIQAERDVLQGETPMLGLQVGHRLTIEEHPYAPFNQEWMIVSLNSVARNAASHSEGATTRDFNCRFTAVPTASSKYRAPRQQVTANVAGVQTAFTTGPAGSEIHPDEHGRVKARMLWDRTDPQDDKSSCWIRTEQPNNVDSMLLPRVGWEVTLRYNEGDVDAPMCFGRMYNALAPPPYALPEGKARSSLQTATSPGDGSSNELRMDDSAGAQEMFLNASKDMAITVGSNMTLKVGNNETREIGANHSLAITNSLHCSIGSNQTIEIGGNQDVAVETFMVDNVTGDHSLDIGGNRDLKVGGDHKHTVTGDSSQEVGGMEIDLVVGKVEEKADGDWEHKVDAALLEITGGDRSYQVVGDRTENVGAVKLVYTKAGRGIEIGGNLTTKVAGAIVHKVKGDKSDKSGGTFTDLVAGAQIVKAKTVTFEGEDLVAVVMGASTLIVSKPAILLAGTSVKWDGVTADTAALIIDN